MSTQEKVTLNLSTVDLGKIDYLVEQGFYSTRSDFMRTAIRNQLQAHEPIVSDEALRAVMDDRVAGNSSIIRSAVVIGLISLDSAYFEKHINQGTRIDLFVVGAVVVGKDVTLDVAKKVIASAKVYGSVTGPQDVVSYIKRAITHKE